MNYSLILSIALYICGCFYMVFGAVIIAINAKSKVNRMFLHLTSSLAIWSFSYSISTSVPTAEMSAFVRSFSAFGWGIFSSLLLHFVLALTKTKIRLNRRLLYVALYLPALINVILFGPFGLLRDRHYLMEQTTFGWMNRTPMYTASIWLTAYYVVFSLATLIVLFRWWRSIESHTPKKRQATLFLASIMLLFLIEAVIDAIPDMLDKKFFPKMPVLFLIIPTVMLFIVLKKFGLISETTRITYSFPEIKKYLAAERSRLFNTATVIFLLGGALSFLVGYFANKGSLERELLLALFLIFFGLLSRFIPVITKKHAVQDAIFLAICALGTFYFMIVNEETGALTVWAVYILFLLFTVILDDKNLASVFTVFCVIIQVLFWIIYPKVSVTIDGSEYATRISIIMLSYFIVRYLTNEYALKVKGYERFAIEQEALERISTSFISINRENAKDTIDEMLVMADEILQFSHAYLIDFSADHEDITILSTHVNDVESVPVPFQPGMKVDMATFPIVKPLVDQGTPMMCEDISHVSVEEDKEQRDFFMSRGVLSYFALPISVDGKVSAILIVEYSDPIEISIANNRLHFLKIIVNVLADAKKKILYEERLYKFAYFDETTKLANKSMLIKRLDQIINDRKGAEKIAVLDVELENFRNIIDTFGQSTGEQIMIESAKILEKLLGKSCNLARTGEGAFIIILPTEKNVNQIEAFAKKVLDSFSNPISTGTDVDALFVVISIGISVYPDDGGDATALLKSSNLASYEAKNTDKQIMFYTERLESQIAETTMLTNMLFKSSKNKEFFLEYQPQIRCETGKTVGVEALLRWTNDDNERIPPDRFIPILEQTGLIHDVGSWVLKEALEEHNRLVAKGFPPLRFSINLSVVQFQSEDFIPDVTKIVEQSGVDPKYIELEITESFFSENPTEIIELLYKLKGLGVSIAIDDFGKEYSSLNRLNRIPFDRIKIDKDIISYFDLERKRAPVTEGIILLAKFFNASITAEGVETKEQAEFLISLDCDEIQGFYYSRPLSTEALEEFLKNE
jgi:diguanylate cyclase (GGDEF)-like protein